MRVDAIVALIPCWKQARCSSGSGDPEGHQGLQRQHVVPVGLQQLGWTVASLSRFSTVTGATPKRSAIYSTERPAL